MAQPLVRSLSTRTVKKLEKPRPLRTSASQSKVPLEPSSPNVPLQDLMTLVESASQCLLDKNYNDLLTSNVATMHARLKVHGPQLEAIFKDQLDRAFVIFRDGCQDDGLLCATRLHLLELVELRANQWTNCDNSHTYYSAKMAAAELQLEPIITADGSAAIAAPISAPSPPMPPVLGPGEVLKTSGKFSKPTKIPGKNYCKDEVVIRNSDSGKVMGIKGRRVHMIEELSETIISFQREIMRPLIIRSPVMWNSARYLYPPRFFPPSYHPPFWTPRPGYIVNPGAKERLVQITGPSEDKIVHARQLMEETIRRNASPVREMNERERMGGSSSSLNSSASDESNRLNQSGSRRSVLLHSYSTNDASLGEYKYTVTLGNDTVKLTGTNYETVRNARLVLEEYYNTWLQKNCIGDAYGLDDVFVDPHQDMACYRLDSIDSGLDPGLAYPVIYQPERRPVLGRSNSIPLSPTSASQNQVAVSRKYSREFLMMCAESHHSRAPPLNWERIVLEVPAIVKKVDQVYYDPYHSPYTYNDAWTYYNPYIYH